MTTQSNSFSNVTFVPSYIMFGSIFSNTIFKYVSDKKVDIVDGIYQDCDLQDEVGELKDYEKFFCVQNGFVFRSLGSVANYETSFTEKSIKSAITKLKKYSI